MREEKVRPRETEGLGHTLLGILDQNADLWYFQARTLQDSLKKTEVNGIKGALKRNGTAPT